MAEKEPADRAAELKEHAERTREALGETMHDLSDKLDVQARANEGIATARQATAQVKDAATRALDEAERRIDDLPEPVREPAHRTVAVVRQRPALLLAGLAGVVLRWRLFTRRSRG